MGRLYFVARIDEGLRQAETGDTISHEDAKRGALSADPGALASTEPGQLHRSPIDFEAEAAQELSVNETEGRSRSASRPAGERWSVGTPWQRSKGGGYLVGSAISEGCHEDLRVYGRNRAG